MTVAIANKSKDLGLLKLKKPVRVVMLPTDAKSVVVNYSASSALRITCSFSSKTREIRVKRKKRKTKITTPPLLMSICYSDTPTPDQNLVRDINLWGYYNRDTSTLWAAPYVLANVGADGNICFGSHRPKDLRSAYNIFWTAPFNDELAGEAEEVFYGHEYDDYEYDDVPYLNGHNVEDFMKKYKKQLFDRQNWEDYTHIVCGTKYWASTSPSDAILVTQDKGLLKQLPKKSLRKQGSCALFIAKAKRYKKVWVFDSGTIKFKLATEHVSTGPAKFNCDDYDDDYDDYDDY